MKKQGADVIGAKAGAKPKKPYIQKDTIGSTQHAEIVYGIGDGENGGLINGLNSIILDDTRVIGDSGEINFNEVKYEERFGLIDQPPLKLIEDTITERGLNLEVRYAAPVVSSFNNKDVDKFVVRISVPSLMQNKDNGDSVAATISYAIDIAVDGGAYQTVLEASATEKITDGYEFDHEIEAPEGTRRTIRVRRTKPDSTSQLLIDKFYVAAISEVINAKFSHPTLHYIGLVFNAEQFNNIPKAVFHYYGRKIKVPVNYNPTTRQYDGIWNGTFKVVYSNNPAWVLFDILTDRRSGLGRRIPVELVDKWELYRIAQYCDELVPDGEGGMEPRFVCNNLVLNSKQDAYQVLKDIASIFRGQSFWNGSQVVTVADAPRDIDYAISMASVISYSYSGTARNARHNVVKVQYYDKNNEYAAAYEYATDYDSIRETEQINEVEIRAFGCTSAGQAQRLARYTLLSEQTETRILTAKLSIDAFVNMQIGDVFAWSDKFLAGANNGGRVVAVNGAVLTLDRDVTDSALVGDTLFVNTTSGKASTRTITAINGNKVTLDAVMSTTEPEFVWVIDSAELSLLYFKLDDYKVNPAEGTVDIVGIQHVNSKFNTIDSETALEAPPFSKVEIETLRAPGNVITSFNVRVDQGLNIADLYVSWGQVKGATRYTVEFRRDSQAWRVLGNVTGLTHTIENVSAGIYEVRVRAADSIGNLSPYGFSAPINVAGIVLPPPKLASFTAVGKLLAIETKWSFPAGTEASLAVVIEHATQDPKNVGVPTQKLNIPYPQTEYVFNGLGAHTKMWFRAAIVDKYNQEGAFTAWTTATADANPEELIDVISGHISEDTLDQTLKGKIDGAGALAGEAQDLANQANTAAANAQTTANNAGTAAADAAGKATNAANAVAKEVTDRVAAVTAETNARTAALTKEATDRAAAISKETTDRAAAINKESTDRAAALTAQENTLKADSAAKVKALKDEVDPQLATLQNGITQVNTDYKAGDTAVVGQLNAYKTSNDNAVASVLQKAESAVSTGATNSSAITAINGQISTINGALSTKLDASVIAGYYTKGQTDAKAAEIAAGKVEEFSASLKSGGDNVLKASNVPIVKESGASGYFLGRYIAGFSSADMVGKRFTLTACITVKNIVGTQYLCAYQSGSKQVLFEETALTKNADKAIVHAVFDWTVSTNNLNFYLYPNRAADSTNAEVIIHWAVMVEGDSIKAASWYPAASDTQAALDANSTAIQNTNAEVSRVDGRVTAANEATTALAGRVSTVEGSVATKAEAAALTALTTRVSNAEGVNTSQGSAITSLENTVNHTTTGLASKASSTALTAVDNKVTAANGRIDTTNSNVATLTGRVSTVEGAVSTKAEAAALTALTTRVSNAEGVNTSQGSAITSLENSVNHATTGLASKASSSALTAVDNKVTAANGRIDTTNSNVTTLTGRVDTVEGDVAKKADASALTELTTRVGNAEGVNTSQGTAITTLQNTVNHSTTGLATKASTAALTATNSEVTRIDGVVSGHTNQLTQLTSDITAINGTLATKANASALNDIYTKTQTDAKALEIAAGEVNKYNASLSIGIDNLLPTQFNLWEDGYWNSTNGAATSGTAYSRTKADVKIPMLAGVKYSMRGNTRIVLVYYSNADARVGSYDSGTSSAPTTAKVVTPPANTAYARAYLFAASGVMAKPSPFNQQALNDLELMIVKGEHTKLTWQPSSVGAQAQLDANATAIDNTNSEVSRVDGRVTTEANRITSLTGRVDTVEGQVATKAEAAALSSLTTRVTEAEGVNTSQGSAITNLQNTVNHATTGLATKASSAALTAVDNRVTTVDGRVNTTNSNVAALTGRVDTVEGAVATKASADAVNALTTRVGTVEGGLESASSNITSLTNSLDASISDIRFVPTQVSIDAAVKTSASSVIELMDDASTTVPKVIKVKGATSSSNIFAGPHVQINPNTLYKVRYKVKRLSGTGTFYLAVMPLTQNKANGVNNSNSTVSVNSISSTTYPFTGSTSAAPVDVWKEGVYYIKGINPAGASGSGTLASPRIMPNLAAFLRLGAIVPANTEFAIEYFTVEAADADALDAANTAATSAAIATTNSEVARVDGRVTTTNSNVATLTGRVSTVEGDISKKADASALTSLTTRVEAEEGKSTSQGAAITALENSVNHATTGLATKASSTALTAVDNKVTAVDGRVNTTNSNVTALTGRVSNVEGELTKKATVAALDALTTRVSDTESGMSTQATKTTALEARLESATNSTALNFDYPLADRQSWHTQGSNQATMPDAKRFITINDGKIADTVFDVPVGTSQGFVYNRKRLTNDRKYKVSFWARRSAEAVGASYVTVARIGKAGVYTSANYTYIGITSQIPANGEWALVETIIDYTGASATYPYLFLGFCVNNSTTAGWSQVQGYKVEEVLTATDFDSTVATAAALQTTDAQVNTNKGDIATHTQQITALNGSISTLQGQVSTKADASALSSLTARVVAEEGKSTSQGTAITNLENTVNNSTTGLATKASAQALTTLNNQVQHSTTGLSAVNTKVDNLKATVENTTSGLPSKASSAALDTLSNKVNHSTTGLDAIANKTTVLEADVSKALDAVTVNDTRSTNQPPSWYWTNYPKRVVNEFKSLTAIGVSGFFGGTYCNLETKVYYGDSSGGPLIQTATSAADPSLYVQRRSNGTTAWTAWAQPIKDLRDSVASKASASAVESLTTRVSTAEGKISSEATKLSNLTTTVDGHTTTINSHTTSINGIQGVHALKIETNGVISGYGLVSELIDGQVKSQFGVNADNFFIGAPSNGKKPFVVYTTPGVINGVTVPAGTYIDTAFIGAATIGTAHINDLAVTTAKIGNGQITTAKIGDLQVDTLKIANNAVTVPSTSFVASSIEVPTSTWVTVASLYVEASEGPSLVTFNTAYNVSANGSVGVGCRILRDTAVVRDEFQIIAASLVGGNSIRPSGSVSTNYLETGQQNAIIYVQMRSTTGTNITFSHRTLTSLVVKK